MTTAARAQRLTSHWCDIPAAVQIAATPMGKGCAALLLTGGLWLLEGNLAIGFFAFVISCIPRWRRPLCALAGVATLLAFTNWQLIDQVVARAPIAEAPGLRQLCVVATLLVCSLQLHAVYTRPRAFMSRSPFLTQGVIYTAFLVIGSYAPMPAILHVTLWGMLIVYGKVFWFQGYALLDRKLLAPLPLYRRLGNLAYLWGSTSVPFPKGEAYLRKVEARDETQAAVARVKGVQLLLWAVVLHLSRLVLAYVTHGTTTWLTPALTWLGSANLPDFNTVLAQHVAGAPLSRSVAWAAVITNFIQFMLHLTVMGHMFIAGARLCGFNALRNTYKPAYATSIADFYNRIYYYFKELMVDFFFYPAYLRFFKSRPKLRLFFATFSAACCGNIMYHFFHDIDQIYSKGIWQALVDYRVSIIYSVILSLAIAVSQLRSKGQASRATHKGAAVLQACGVLIFYCMVAIFHDPIRSLSVQVYASFIWHLFI